MIELCCRDDLVILDALFVAEGSYPGVQAGSIGSFDEVMWSENVAVSAVVLRVVAVYRDSSVAEQ